LLIDAGSPLEWEPGDGPPESIAEVLDEWRRRVLPPADSR